MIDHATDWMEEAFVLDIPEKNKGHYTKRKFSSVGDARAFLAGQIDHLSVDDWRLTRCQSLLGNLPE